MENRTLGDYNVIKQIGQGSLGTVFLAEHRFMKRQYILKVLPEELASDRNFIQRFEEEVSILSALDHPNLVKIHSVSFSQGQYFLVTDCIVDDMGETTNLAQYILSKGHRPEENEIYSLLHKIAEALDYAHSKKIGGKGMVHRGLKPNNILMGQNKEVLVGDFGLSRIIGVGAVLTRTYKAVAEALGIGSAVSSAKVGSDRYPNPPIDLQKLSPLHASFLQNYTFLAPEQKKADFPIDTKSDMYAFGVLAYFLITGELPEGIFEMPSKKTTGFVGNWDHLIQQCLQQDPAKRPEALVPALEEVFDVSKQNSFSSMYVPSPKEEYTAQSDLIEAMQVKLAAPVNAEVLQLAASGKLRPVIHDPQLERPVVDHDPAAAFRIDSTVKQYHPESKEVKNIQPMLTDMVIIEGGNFWRGSNDGNRDETPHHQITLSSFAIDVHPVTNEQFARFLRLWEGKKTVITMISSGCVSRG